jgi:hypothetical protein
LSFGGSGRPIGPSEDLRRIKAIPRREAFTFPDLGALADNIACIPRPIQEQALKEILAARGGLIPIAVGGGKTLVSLLAPTILGNPRSVLLLPANLVEKTESDRSILRGQGWDVSMSIQIHSYESLGRIAKQGALEFFGPELIIADEVHKLKRLKAAVTRRVRRYMQAHPETMFIGLSGTILEKALEQFAHLLIWALKENAPVPIRPDILREWGEALDPKVDDFKRRDPGAILELKPGAQTGAEAFQDRLRSTVGIVFSGEEQDYKGSLSIQRITYKHSEITDANFKKLRDDALTPDGWALTEAVDIWRVARQLAIGLHYIWDPRPPDPWFIARKGWAKFAREVLSRSRTLDSELAVVHAVDAGELDDMGLLAAWRAAAPTFEIHVKDVWHDDTALNVAKDWIHSTEEPGIVWCEHGFFARELSRIAKVDYFGAQGLNKAKERIDDASRSGYGKTCIASVKANATGRNLQAWSRALVTAPVPDPGLWEQLLGREHRAGQLADSVSVDVFFACREHANAFDKALETAHANFQMNGQSNKLLLADILPPPKRLTGAAWRQ